MLLRSVLFLLVSFSVLWLRAQTRGVVVVDSLTRMPLPGASVFDHNGNAAGICGSNGRLPYISPDSYPLTIRILGYKEKRVAGRSESDTIFMQEHLMELPEVVVESRDHKVLHILAYVREYSTLTTYSDTVFLFREKMVDYMLPQNKKGRFKGWSTPRILKSKSYYRFSNYMGLDSVSDAYHHHFSWADWIGIPSSPALPPGVRSDGCGSDTLHGKYSPAEVWTRREDRVAVDVDILADTTSRKWVPNLSVFFRDYLDFERFRLRLNYDNLAEDSLSARDLARYSFNIESNGRGHDLFTYKRADEPFFVTTYAEVYVLDKEFITVKEARKWDLRQVNMDAVEIYEPADAPALQPSVLALVERVNSLDRNGVRLGQTPDHRLAGRHVAPQNFGKRMLQLLKTVTGISDARSKRKWNKQWKDFKQGMREKNNKDLRESDSENE